MSHTLDPPPHTGELADSAVFATTNTAVRLCSHVNPPNRSRADRQIAFPKITTWQQSTEASGSRSCPSTGRPSPALHPFNHAQRRTAGPHGTFTSNSSRSCQLLSTEAAPFRIPASSRQGQVLHVLANTCLLFRVAVVAPKA